MSKILSVDNLHKRFGAVRAVNGMSLSVEEGEILGIIGPNGSGKTTLFNCITGFLKPNSGTVSWLGKNITGWAPNRIAKSGLVRTFQFAETFPSESVRANVEVAAQTKRSAAFRRVTPNNGRFFTTIEDLLDFAGLQQRVDAVAGSLPYGDSRKLGVAVALATSPALMMLDEPSTGLNDAESNELGELLTRIRSLGVTLAVIDHDMGFLLPVCDRVIAMDAGEKIAEGPPQTVQSDPTVIRVYLGDRVSRG